MKPAIDLLTDDELADYIFKTQLHEMADPADQLCFSRLLVAKGVCTYDELQKEMLSAMTMHIKRRVKAVRATYGMDDPREVQNVTAKIFLAASQNYVAYGLSAEDREGWQLPPEVQNLFQQNSEDTRDL